MRPSAPNRERIDRELSETLIYTLYNLFTPWAPGKKTQRFARLTVTPTVDLYKLWSCIYTINLFPQWLHKCCGYNYVTCTAQHQDWHGHWLDFGRGIPLIIAQKHKWQEKGETMFDYLPERWQCIFKYHRVDLHSINKAVSDTLRIEHLETHGRVAAGQINGYGTT